MDERLGRTARRRRLRWALSLGSAATALAAGVALAASASAGAAKAGAAPAASPTWAQATGVKLPAGGTSGLLLGASCTSSGFCVAAGQFQKTAKGTTLAMVVSNGGTSTWTAQALVLPKTAFKVPQAVATDVACTSSTSCEVIGRFRYAKSKGTKNNLFIADLTASGWTQARTMALPANSAKVINATLSQISCASQGNCGALGTYIDNRNDLETAAFIETNGKWNRGVPITPPANGGSLGHQNVQPFGISCPVAGDCVAVGKYITTGGDTEPFRATSTNGVWARAVQVGLPSGAIKGKNQQGDFHAVTCTPDTRACLAVGNYRTAVVAHSNAVYSLLESAGTWPAAGTAFHPAPANVANPPVPQDNGLACPSAGCVTVGFYSIAGGGVGGLSDAYSGGTWQPAVQIPNPSGAAVGSGQTVMKAVSCWGTWSCVAVGGYTDKAGHQQALIATSS
jgi:hypothetical protein